MDRIEQNDKRKIVVCKKLMKKTILSQCVQWSLKYNTPIKHAQFDCYKHHTFVIQGNQIIEWGQNKSGPPPTFYKSHQKIHSEYIAYKKARGILNKLKPFDIVNVRMNKQGNLRLSRPCLCCCNFLKTMGCKRVYFSSGIGDGFDKMAL